MIKSIRYPYYIMFQNKSLFRMLLIKKNVRGTLIHEPENRKASLCPGDIDSRA